jgi:hypothetical protein
MKAYLDGGLRGERSQKASFPDLANGRRLCGEPLQRLGGRGCRIPQKMQVGQKKREPPHEEGVERQERGPMLEILKQKGTKPAAKMILMRSERIGDRGGGPELQKEREPWRWWLVQMAVVRETEMMELEWLREEKLAMNDPQRWEGPRSGQWPQCEASSLPFSRDLQQEESLPQLCGSKGLEEEEGLTMTMMGQAESLK